MALGSMKANAGHSEPGAGFSGLLKLAIGLARGDGAPNAQLRALNPHVGSALRGASCTLPVQLGGLAFEGQVNGGGSSFGYSGTIAHTVLHHARSASTCSLLASPLMYQRCAFPWRCTRAVQICASLRSSTEARCTVRSLV